MSTCWTNLRASAACRGCCVTCSWREVWTAAMTFWTYQEASVDQLDAELEVLVDDRVDLLLLIAEAVFDLEVAMEVGDCHLVDLHQGVLWMGILLLWDYSWSSASTGRVAHWIVGVTSPDPMVWLLDPEGGPPGASNRIRVRALWILC